MRSQTAARCCRPALPGRRECALARPYGSSCPYHGYAAGPPAYGYYRPSRRYYAGYRPYWAAAMGRTGFAAIAAGEPLQTIPAAPVGRGGELERLRASLELPVSEVDERFSTAAADRAMREDGKVIVFVSHKLREVLDRSGG